MVSTLRRAALAVLIAVAIPTFASAQQAAPSTTEAERRELETAFAEFQRVHMQLEGLQGQALQDPQLSAVQEALGSDIREAMEVVDPMMSERMARAMVLESEAHAAQQSGDSERLEVLTVEADAIQQHFMAVQQQVASQPEIASRITAFQSELERKMIELNPEARDLIVRFRELESRLSSAMANGS